MKTLQYKKASFSFEGKDYTVEVGKFAKQTEASAFVTCGETTVLVTLCYDRSPKEADFVPLTVDYLEKYYAAGKIPGGYLKRESKPRDSETLIGRIIDRTIRPLFDENWRYETQLVVTVLSYDRVNDTDVLSLLGASVCLELSSIPFSGPIIGLRLYRDKDGELHINNSQFKANNDLDLFVSYSDEGFVMVEGGGNHIPESVVIDTLMTGLEKARPFISFVKEFSSNIRREKLHVIPPERNKELEQKVRAKLNSGLLRQTVTIPVKTERYAAIKALKEAVVTEFHDPENKEKTTDEIKTVFEQAQSELVREMIVKEGKRIDGRGTKNIRNISTEVGVLPRTHGSSLFTRGETQGLVIVTLGTEQDQQRVDALDGDQQKRFMLHYNFPGFSVGEVKPLRGPGRREIGHGALAERALKQVLPEVSQFPYSIRVVSEILESNGSSSMATVCGGSLALMDAGVPIVQPIAGIAMGLVKENETVVVLSDILGDEDHLGDMDFKVCGSSRGVTAVQMDIKIKKVSREVLEAALAQAKEGRLHILSVMEKSLGNARPGLSKYAPRIETIRIATEKIKDIIGPGGKIIKDIIAQTGVSIDIQDTGIVSIASTLPEAIEAAKKIIFSIVKEPEVGEVYTGKVKKIVDFGAFVEIAKGVEGLVHISELEHRRVGSVSEILKEGDTCSVKVLAFDPKSGKIQLSRKALIPKT